MVQALSWAGLFIMVGCTVTTLHNMGTASSGLPAKYLPPSPAAIVVSKPALVVRECRFHQRLVWTR